MASIRKRGDLQWQAEIRRKGFPDQRRTFNTRLDAEKWARQIENEIDRGVFVSRAEAEATTIGVLIDRYLVEVTPQKRSARNEGQRLRFLRSVFGDKVVAALQSKDVAAFRDKRLKDGRAAGTVIKELNTLSHLIDTAIKEWGIFIPTNPVKLIRRPSAARGRDRRLSKDEEVLLLAACRASKSPAVETAVRLALETGMRLGELLALEWRHVDLARKVAHLPDTKNGDSRDVPLSPDAIKTFRDWPRSIAGRVFPQWARADSFESAWRRAVQRARKSYEKECQEGGKEPLADFLADLRFHDLRHEATSRLAGVLMPHELAKAIGQKTLQMVMRYYHPRAEDLAKKLG